MTRNKTSPKAIKAKQRAKKVEVELEPVAVSAEIVEKPLEPAPEEIAEIEDWLSQDPGALPATSTALTPADPVTQYMAELRKYPVLTREQEEELAIKYYETGDPKAAEILVTSNLRFVVKVAAEYSRFGAKLIDLIQEGNMGLMHAVREFNPYKGVRVISYAVWWIRGYIQDYLMKQQSLVRMGTTQAQRKLFYNLKKESDAIVAEGLEPTPALLGSRLGVSEKDVTMMAQRLSGRDLSLDQKIDSDSPKSLHDFLNSTTAENIDDQLGNLEAIEILKNKIEQIKPTLNERELELLELRLLADNPLTLQEIGERYQVTREAVRQMEQRLFNKIKESFLKAVNQEP